MSQLPLNNSKSKSINRKIILVSSSQDLESNLQHFIFEPFFTNLLFFHLITASYATLQRNHVTRHFLLCDLRDLIALFYNETDRFLMIIPMIISFDTDAKSIQYKKNTYSFALRLTNDHNVIM